MDRHATPEFHRLAPASPSYATDPIADAFDWDRCARPEDRGEWYLVCFRSVRRPEADEALLLALDDRAHRDAASAPGFLHYFKGPANDRGECLSFCLWETSAAARSASGRPAHVEAALVVHDMYASYRLELYRLKKRAGHRFEFEPYRARVRARSRDVTRRTSGTDLTAVDPAVAVALATPVAPVEDRPHA